MPIISQRSTADENQQKLDRQTTALSLALQDKGASFFADLERSNQQIVMYMSSYANIEQAVEHGFDLVALQGISEKIITLYNYKLAMSTEQLWQCCNVLDATIKLQQHTNKTAPTTKGKELLAEYKANRARILKFLLPSLTTELKLLKVLFASKEYKLIVRFLRRYFATPTTNLVAKQELIKEIEVVTENKYLALAKKTLEREYPEFTTLSLELQKSLLEQQAYIILLTSHYDFIGGKTGFQENQLRREYLAKLAANVVAALDMQKSNDVLVAQGKQEFKTIETKLRKIEADARNNVLIDAIVDGVENILIDAPLKLFQKISDVYNAPAQKDSPFSPMVYGLIGLQLCYVYYLGYLPSFASLKSVFDLSVLGAGVTLTKKTIESNTVKFLQIEDQLETLQELPDFDAAFLDAQEKYWHSSGSIQSATNIDITRVENKYFQEKYDAALESLREFYKEKETKIKDEVRKFVNDSTSSSKELFFDFVKVMSGVVFVVTAVLITVFAISGLTGPFLLFAFVPALSTSIIAGLAVITAKLNFEDNPTANKIIDSFVWICYSPVVFLFSGLEFMFRPINSLYAMFQADKHGNKPSKNDKIIGVATIALGVIFAVGLGVGLPFIAPVVGISIGLAATIGVILGIYSGLTLGVIAKQTYDRIINRPTVKIATAKDKLLSIVELNNKPRHNEIMNKFKTKLPLVAPGLLDVLKNRATDILRDVENLEAELPNLWSVTSTEIQKIPESHGAEPVKEHIEPEIQVKLTNIAKKIATLQSNHENLLQAFNTYEEDSSPENKEALNRVIDTILLNEFETSKQEFKARSLAITHKQQQPGYPESIKPVMLFNKDAKSFTLIEPPAFTLEHSQDYAKDREKLSNLRNLKQKMRSYRKT